MRFPLSAGVQWRRPDPVSAGRRACTGALRFAGTRAPCAPRYPAPRTSRVPAAPAAPGRRHATRRLL